MFSPNELDTLMARIISQLGTEHVDIYKILSVHANTESTPEQLDIIRALLHKRRSILAARRRTEVKSVLIDRDQTVDRC